MVNSHEPKAHMSFTNGPTFVTASSVHGFKDVYLAVRIIRYGRGKDACVFLADWIATLAYIDL